MVTVLHEGPPAITDRQLQVIELIAAGYSNEEVARRLGISPRTAKAHSDVLRQKLGCARRRQIPSAYRTLTGRDPLPKGLGAGPPASEGLTAPAPAASGSQARRLSRTSWPERSRGIGLRQAGCGARATDD